MELKIKISSNIDKKYGMLYYTYLDDNTIVAKKMAKTYKATYNENNETYTISVIVSNGHYKVTSKSVEITTPELNYSVNITMNSAGTGWSQRTTSNSGILTGYTITYYCSPTSSTSTYYTTTTDLSITNKEEGKKYYIWAIATNGTKSIKSSNYMEIQTKHTHTTSNCYSYQSCP